MTQNSLIAIDSERINRLESKIDLVSNMLLSINPPKELGGMEIAEEVTGLKKSTIYVMVHKNKIPFIKQGGKLYFKRSELISWIESGKEVKNVA